ncbi:MAG TPA: hypothetical protein PKW14_00030 [Bacteroidota bacterium]|nr:hypothetical protein [Bacteroidota bacterium]
MNKPEISVITFIGERAFGFNRFYDSFIKTQPLDKIDMIFISPYNFSFDFYDMDKFNSFRIIKYIGEDYFKIIKEAIKGSYADYILFQENHIFHEVNIIDTLLNYIKKEEFAGVGCLVSPGDKMSIIDWVGYLTHYLLWQKGTKGGEHFTMIPGHNSIYKKNILLSFYDKLEYFLYSDTVMQWKLLDEGYKLYLTDEVYLIHDDKMSFSNLLFENFYNGWLFSYARRKINDWGILKNITYSFLIFGKPLLRMYSYLKTPKNQYNFSLSKRIIFFFLVTLSYFINALGESLGCYCSDKPVLKIITKVH